MDQRSRQRSSSGQVSRWLATYLRNHASAGRAGVDLFDRAARSQARRPWGPELAALATEVREDCDTLTGLLRTWGVRPDPFSTVALRLGERAGRFKPNGQLVRRSPLSDLIEVEAGMDAVHAKAGGWRALRAASLPPAPVDLDELLRRADDQVARLGELHGRVAASVL